MVCKRKYIYIHITYTSTEACNIIHMYWKHLCKLSIYPPHIVYAAYSERIWCNLDTNQIPILTTDDKCLQGFQVLPAFVDTIHSSLKGKERERATVATACSLKKAKFEGPNRFNHWTSWWFRTSWKIRATQMGSSRGRDEHIKKLKPLPDCIICLVLVSLFSMEIKCVF